MKISRFIFTGAGALALAFLSGCQMPEGPGAAGPAPVISRGSNPNPVAYRPKNPGAVRVKVSLSTQQVYVLEGDRPLLVAATCVGMATKPTPKGHFRVFQKISNKRSGSYGFYRSGGKIYPAELGKGSGEYIGYPMPFWVEFAPAYGFHQGWVWPQPRTHGCLRLHPNVAAKFYELVRVGTPVDIAESQPEDATIGKDVPRPVDYNDPDPANEYMMSSQAFSKPSGPLLQ